MESFVSELTQEVRCSLCKDRLTEPKLLKCFHTYCKACIKRHAQLQPNGGGNIFNCPECLAETLLPELDDVDDLNSSPLHTRILKVLVFVESDKVCSFSKSHSAASWYCFGCNCSMCSECHSCHLAFMKDNHKVVSLSNLKKEDLEFMLANEDNCERHGSKLDFYCQKCDVLICIECLKCDHDDHNIILNKNHSLKIRSNLGTLLKHFEKQQQRLFSSVNILEDISISTTDQGEMVIKQISEKAKEIIEKVKQNELELVEKIKEHMEKNNRRKTEAQSELDQKKSAIKYLTQVIERNLSVSKMMELKESRVDYDESNPLPFFIEFGFLPFGPISIKDDSKLTFLPSQAYLSLMKEGLGKLSKSVSSYRSTSRTEK